MKLYHGSPRKLIGNKLIPKISRDVYDRPENIQKGVYATDVKNAAIAMAILGCEGIHGGGLNSKDENVPGIIYEGSPQQDYIYLYTLSSKNFVPSSKQGHQYISKEPTKPIKTEKLKVNDYLHLVRNANQDEIEKFNQQLRKKGILK